MAYEDGNQSRNMLGNFNDPVHGLDKCNNAQFHYTPHGGNLCNEAVDINAYYDPNSLIQQ